MTTTGVPTNAITNAVFAGCTPSVLPSGVTLTDNGNNTATLAGKPAAGTGGTYTICLNASNGVGAAATQTFTLTVDQAPAITSTSSATFTVGTQSSFSVTTTGVPTNAISDTSATGCTKSSPALPSGVTLTDNGNDTATLAGKPAAGTTGTYTICLNASNGVGAGATQKFTLTVDQAPAITSASSATFTVGTQSSFSVTTTGVPTNTISDTSANGCTKSSPALPSGVTLTSNGNNTATLAGKPAVGTGGTYTICLNASNSAGSATQKFTLTVDQAPAITSATSATFTIGSAGSFTVVTTGVPTNAISDTSASGCTKSSPALPSGVTLTNNGNDTATLAGTPALATAGTYTICLNASNGVGSAATQKFTLTVAKIAQAITFASTPPATPVVGGSYTVVAHGGASGNAVTFTIDSSSAAGACSISGAAVTFTGAGKCVIDANQAGNTSYLAAAQAQQTMTVTVTASGIAALTLEYVQGSAKYASSSASTKATITAAANVLSSLLNPVGPHLAPAQMRR